MREGQLTHSPPKLAGSPGFLPIRSDGWSVVRVPWPAILPRSNEVRSVEVLQKTREVFVGYGLLARSVGMMDHAAGNGRSDQLTSRLGSVIEHTSRQNSEIECSQHTCSDSQPSGEGHGRDGNFSARLAHVHHYDHAQIIVSAHRTVNQSNDGQANQVSLEGCAEDIELPKETAGNWNSNQ